MFANTLTLTINAVDKVLKRLNQDNYGSHYRFTSGDGQEIIELRIRHTVDTTADGPIDRHNMYIERTILATPTTAKQYWSDTRTLRALRGSSVDSLLHLSVGVSTLQASVDQDLVLGEN